MTKEEITQKLKELRSMVSRQRFQEAIDETIKIVEEHVPRQLFDRLLDISGMVYDEEKQTIIDMPVIYDEEELYHGQQVSIWRCSENGAASIAFMPEDPETKLISAEELMDYICEECGHHSQIESNGWRDGCKCWVAAAIDGFQKCKDEYANGHWEESEGEDELRED